MNHHAFIYDYVCLKPEQQIGLHTQSTWELVYMVRGQGSRTIGGKAAPAIEGEIVLIPPGIPHVWDFDPATTDTDGNIVNITVFFEPVVLNRIETFFPEAGQAASQLKLLTTAVAYTGEARKRISQQLRAMNGLAPEARLGKMFELIVLLANANDRTEINCNRTLTKTESRMERIRVFCACNYARSIDLGEIAGHVNMSKSSFCTFMRRQAGLSFSAYLNQYRLERAMTMLVRTEDSIAEIAYKVGFNNVTYFNRLFKAHFGCTPKAKRKTMASP